MGKGPWEACVCSVLKKIRSERGRSAKFGLICCVQPMDLPGGLHVHKPLPACTHFALHLQAGALLSSSRTCAHVHVQVEAALQIFEDMVARGCERNVITYSSLISACEKAGQWRLALQLFSEMHRDGCKPNVVTHNALIAACGQGECACALSTPSHLLTVSQL